jgi:hypothetical protein
MDDDDDDHTHFFRMRHLIDSLQIHWSFPQDHAGLCRSSSKSRQSLLYLATPTDTLKRWNAFRRSLYRPFLLAADYLNARLVLHWRTFAFIRRNSVPLACVSLILGGDGGEI